MPERDKEMGRFDGILEGIKRDLKEIKTDVKRIESNDYNKIERISKCESKIDNLNEWREHHIDDNNAMNGALKKFKKDFEDYKDSSRTWNFILLAGLVSLLIGIIIDIMRTGGV